MKGKSFEPSEVKADQKFKRVGEQEGGWFFPIFISLFLHGSLVALLLLLVPREEVRVIKPPPSFVAARIVAVEPPPVKIPPKTVPPRVVPAKPEPDQAAIALERKQKEERKQRAEEQRQQELKKRREQELAKKREQEKLKRQRAEELRKKRERERVLKQQQEQELQAALAREAEQAAADAGVVAGYAGLMQRVVESQWTRPASARRGMKATLRIKLLPTGELISVQILAGSGNEAFDRSAVQAVERAAPFTELQGMDARLFDKNFRTLRFVFNPEDLLK